MSEPKTSGGYRDLEVWKLARELAIKVHRMTLTDLPKFEMYEEGSQIRRSAKSIRHNIVEGYGRRQYKAEFLKFLSYAHGSCDETNDTLDGLRETESLRNQEVYDELSARVDTLGRKLHAFMESVERNHQSPK
jgi:four helix bundle protein